MAKDTIKKKDQLGIIAENMNSQFGLVMEGFSVLTKQIKEVDERLSGEIGGLSAKINNFQAETNSKFETVFNYLSDNDEMMRQLVGRVNGLEQRIYVLETKIIN